MIWERPKLKPCPFCGKKAHIVYNFLRDGYYIGCKTFFGELGSPCPGSIAHQSSIFCYATEQLAIEAWNRREKLDPFEKADAIKILCGENFDSVVHLMTQCRSLIHNLNANSFRMSEKYVKNWTYGDVEKSHYVQKNVGKALEKLVKNSNDGEEYKGGVSQGCIMISEYFAALAEQIHHIENNSQY